MSSGFGLMCVVCFNGLMPETCVVDVLGNKWDICPGECAEKADIQIGPVNIYVFNQLELEDIEYQKQYKASLKRNLEVANRESGFLSSGQGDSIGLFQQRPAEW
jgi:hypothetical protein